jgi:nucleotide-binding universal stress UspA family protein
MMKKLEFDQVVVAIDLTEFSAAVVEQARLLSQILNKPLSYVYVEQKGDINLETLPKLILEKYKIENPKDIYVLMGDPSAEILQFAGRYSRPLIVAGHRSRQAVAEFFWGSVAKKLALFSKFPVWIHRSGKTIHPKKVMLPLSFDPFLPELVQAGQDVCRIFDSELEVFHSMRLPSASVDTNSYGIIYEAFKEVDDGLVQQFKNQYPQIKLAHSDGEPGFEVREYAKFFDLMVLAPKYRGGKQPFFGTTTTHLMSSGETPILILPGLNRVSS